MLLKGMEFDTAHFITDVSGKYPRLWALKGAHPVIVNRWYKFGVLASIRTVAPGSGSFSCTGYHLGIRQSLVETRPLHQEKKSTEGRKRIKAVLGIAEGIQDYGITCCGCVIEMRIASKPLPDNPHAQDLASPPATTSSLSTAVVWHASFVVFMLSFLVTFGKGKGLGLGLGSDGD
ncbi:hypothetical protein ACS0TY_022017 [Phlomoides rotata]